MSLNADDLAEYIADMPDVKTAAEGVDNFAVAFEAYFYEAELTIAALPTGYNVQDDSLRGAREAMIAAMLGTIQSNGYAAIQSGILAFWGFVSVSFANIWKTAPPLASVLQPVGVAGIAAALAPAGAANVEAQADKQAAAVSIAAVIHAAQAGGTATDTTTPTPLVWSIV